MTAEAINSIVIHPLPDPATWDVWGNIVDQACSASILAVVASQGAPATTVESLERSDSWSIY